MSGKTDQPWGFWVVIRNKVDADFAIKMSGLPIFLLGTSSLLVGTVFALRGSHYIAVAAIMAVISAVLIWSGLRIRSGKYGTFFPSTLVVLFALSGHLLSESVAITILGALQGILMLSGVRGWLYLRRASPEE